MDVTHPLFFYLIDNNGLYIGILQRNRRDLYATWYMVAKKGFRPVLEQTLF